MQIRMARVLGKFDSAQYPSDPGCEKHRVLVRDVLILWQRRDSRDAYWREESLKLSAGFRWDGASRPNFVGFLVPRWGIFSPASAAHDRCFGDRPYMSDGKRISRKHADLLFLELMKYEAGRRPNDNAIIKMQILLATVMYRAVRWFGFFIWDQHDNEYRK